MAAQALYRVWRSQTFDELVGQEHVVQTLRNAIVEEHLAHAYLFTGPRGVGKTTMARLLAKAVNCTAPAELRPCGECESCRAVADGRAVDVIELDAASHTSVDDAREIIERVQFRPTNGRYKVYIIDEVHMLSTAAFNALLKTLEEPPGHALFILATTEIHKVPATILSRCQRFNFSRHSIAATVDHLQRVAQGEELTLEPAAAEAIARASTGSMRDALSVLDQLQSYGSRTITLELVRSLLGSSEAAEVSALINALLDGDLGTALRVVNEVADQGADLRQFARDLVERLRALLLIGAGGADGLLDATEDELAVMQAQVARSNVGTLLQWVKLFSGLDFQLRTSPYGQLPLELVVVEALIGPAPAVAVAPPRLVAARPAAPTPAVSSQPARQPAPAPVRPKPAPIATPTSSAPPVEIAPVLTPPVAASQEPQPAAVSETSDDAVAEQQPASAPAVKWDDDLLPPVEAATVEASPSTEAEEIAPPEHGDVFVAPADLQEEHDHAAIQTANAEISTLERVEAVWPQVVRAVRPKDRILEALLRDVRPVDVEGNTIVLLATSPFHQGQVERPQPRQLIETIVSKQLGANFAIRCTTEAHVEVQDLRAQIRASRKDPWVRAAINVFDADVIGVEQPQESA